MAMRTRAVVTTIVTLLLLSGPWGWQNRTVRAEPPNPPADAEAAPVSVAVVDLQEVLTAAAQINADPPADTPAAAPQRNDPQQLQKEQLRSSFTLALQAAKDVATSRGCDVVLNVKGRGPAQPPPGAVHPYYLAESADLTTDVIARLEARARQIEQPLPAPATRPSVHSAIVTIDVRRAFSQMRHTKDVLAKTQELRRALSQQGTEYREKLAVLKRQRDQAAQDSPERKDLEAKLKAAVVEQDTWGKSAERDWARDQIVAMRDLSQEIATAAAELGRRRGCWLVLVDAQPDIPSGDLSYLQVDQLRAMIASTTILYSAPQADLTNELLQILDAQYTGRSVPWPTTQPTHVAQLPIRIINQAEVARRTDLSPTRLEAAISPLATQRGYTLVFPAIRPKLPENVDNVDLGQLRTLINSINLLYADPAADITAELTAGKLAAVRQGGRALPPARRSESSVTNRPSPARAQ